MQLIFNGDGFSLFVFYLDFLDVSFVQIVRKYIFETAQIFVISVMQGSKFVSLADYNAMGHSEVSLHEGDMVELLKVGCAGWWFVKLLGMHYKRVYMCMCKYLYYFTVQVKTSRGGHPLHTWSQRSSANRVVFHRIAEKTNRFKLRENKPLERDCHHTNTYTKP